MATSGSINYSVSRDDIITEALQHCGVLGEGETPSANQLTDCGRTLNIMVKSWVNHGLHLWKITRATVFLEKDKTSYTLSSTGDNATESYVETTTTATAVATDTVISMTSVTGMSMSDNVLIILDDGTTHSSTISSIATLDVTINDALPSGAAIGSEVYVFTTKINRPLKIIDAFTRDSSNNDTDVDVFSREEYWRLGYKPASGRPTEIYYDPQLSAGVMRTFPTP